MPIKAEAVIYDNDGLLTDSEVVYGRTVTQVLSEDYDVHERVERISTLTAGKSIEKAF